MSSSLAYDDAPEQPASGRMRRPTVQAVRPETIERREVGRPGLVLGGKYRLERRIATGGMASIWAATHETLNRPVAVKFIDARVELDLEARVAQFMHEAQVAASVRHKNVVDILDFGVHDDRGTREPYMVMELLEGEALDQRLRREPLSTDEAVSVIRQVLSGLDAVHAAGIVHRDMKPGNVFILDDGDGLFARVLDFGISQGADDEQDRLVVGTPEYMSPEQALGDSLDGRSDIYSVGVMLYELLAGYLPYDDTDPMRVLQMVVAGNQLSVSAARPDVPELCQVVDKAMALRPHDRYPCARAMQTALSQAVSGRFTPVEPAPVELLRQKARSETPTLDPIVLSTAELAPVRPHRMRAFGLVAACVTSVVAVTIAVNMWSAPTAATAPPPASATATAGPVIAPAPPVVEPPPPPVIAPLPPPVIAPLPTVTPVPAVVAPVAVAPDPTSVPARPAHRARRARPRGHRPTDHITRELDF